MLLQFLFLEQLYTINVGNPQTVGDLKPFIQRKINVPVQYQDIRLDGKQLKDSDVLTEIGLNENSLLLIIPLEAQKQNSNAFDINKFLSLGITDMFKKIKETPSILQEIKRISPELGDMFSRQDAKAIRGWLSKICVNRYKQIAKKQEERKDIERALQQNPYDIEAQKKLEQWIQEEQIELNRRMGSFYNNTDQPLSLLHIQCYINDIPTRAIIDTGAQVSVISSTLASKCNVIRTVDTDFSNKLQGIGEMNSLGKIFSSQLRIESTYFSIPFTVISREDSFCLIGLDFLQPHNAIINLKKHMLLLEVDGVRPPTNTTATTSQEHPVVIEVPFVENTEMTPNSFSDNESSTSLHPKSSSSSPQDYQMSTKREPEPQTMKLNKLSEPHQESPMDTKKEKEMEMNIQVLVSMGINESDAREALVQSRGDVGQAIDYLLQKGLLH